MGIRPDGHLDYEKHEMERIDTWQEYTGLPEFHAVFTIHLGELVESGVFDWKKPILDWSAAAYDSDQYGRICAYFIERFYYREISLVPFKQWARMLRSAIVYELMPKYRELYKNTEDGYNPLALEDEYYKSRDIESRYPETLITNSADYISSGNDHEHERVKIGNITEMLENVKTQGSIDQMLLDELEMYFVGLYTASANGF